MPVNQKDLSKKLPPYTPSTEDQEFLDKLNARMDDLRTYRSALKSNPYDTSPEARTIEETWDFAEYVSLPHKYYHREMRDWMARDSHPLIYAKIDTALSTIIEKNPQIEMSARQEKFEKKSRLLEALYNLSWDKSHGSQQLIKFVLNIAKYGFSVGREYHRYEVSEEDEITQYDPETLNHTTEKKSFLRHDTAYFEVLPIRDCYFDNRAKPYDEDSLRDWFWEVSFDYSTFQKKFPEKKFKNAKFVSPNMGDSREGKSDLSEYAGIIARPAVRLRFYESTETNEFAITDGRVLLFRGPLLNHELSCVTGMWRMRNDFTIYGVGIPEILESNQEMLDRVSNMTMNQLVLSISGSGFYGGTGNVTEKDMLLEPKLKKLRDAEKIIFPKIPSPDQISLKMREDIFSEADEMSGITKSLSGEQVGKTLGEAVLNREAGLRRLSLPLKNVSFALERHANLRVDLLQRIYSRPIGTKVVRDAVGNVVDQKLFQEFMEERQLLGSTSPELHQKFPEDSETGMLFRNEFRTERLPLEKGEKGELLPSQKDQFLEITPEEITGEFDVRIKAFSTIPMSKALEEAKAIETFQLMASLPGTDIYKAQKRVLRKRGEDTDDWMLSDEDIMGRQHMASQASIPMEEAALNETMPPGMETSQMSSPAGMSKQITNQLSL